MFKTKQIAVIISVVLLMGLLLSLDIKGLVKPAEQPATGTADTQISISVESVSGLAKQSLKANLAEEINRLEGALQSATGAQKLELQKQLAQKWDDVNQPAPAAFYYEAIAQSDNTYSNWLKTGDLFTTSYQNSQDTLIQSDLVQKAINAYQKALELDSASLDAKTGLGTAYVTEAVAPMKGIMLLRSVVAKDPENVKANMTLGRFSMESGQFDKAVERFKTVIAKKPDLEAWFLLATSYENLGMKNESIAAYEKSKILAADPSITKFVDGKIEELRKN